MTTLDMSRRSLLAGIAAATGTTLLGAGAAAAALPVIFAAGVDPAYTPAYLANYRNMYANSGLDFKLQTFSQGGDAVDAVATNMATFSGAGEQTTMIRMARAEMRALAIWATTGDFIKLTARQGITDPTQIRKVGVVAGSVSEYCTNLMLEHYNIAPATVEKVRSGPPELPALLARGDIDAYFVWEPWATAGTKVGGTILLKSRDIGYVSTLWLTTNRAWYDQNAEAAKTFVSVMAQACDMAQGSTDLAAEAVNSVIKMDPATSKPIIKEMDFKVRDFSDEDFASFDRIAKFLHDQKVTEKLLDYRPHMVRDFVKGI
ncbi:MAG: ABC transporter substrate-binding protein [Rhizobiaceae bacterium]